MFECKSKIENMIVLLNGTYWSNNIHCDIKHELLHVLNGNMTIECPDGRKYPLQSGDILLIPAGMEHRDVFNSASTTLPSLSAANA
ncbi:MAG: cupin domain-containing protein [Lentisphaeria bacterium]|nr:cupin domain-containing protein [Lentisphaeria bacterium]